MIILWCIVAYKKQGDPHTINVSNKCWYHCKKYYIGAPLCLIDSVCDKMYQLQTTNYVMIVILQKWRLPEITDTFHWVWNKELRYCVTVFYWYGTRILSIHCSNSRIEVWSNCNFLDKVIKNSGKWGRPLGIRLTELTENTNCWCQPILTGKVCSLWNTGFFILTYGTLRNNFSIKSFVWYIFLHVS